VVDVDGIARMKAEGHSLRNIAEKLAQLSQLRGYAAGK
jgi:hypothetical protein